MTLFTSALLSIFNKEKANSSIVMAIVILTFFVIAISLFVLICIIIKKEKVNKISWGLYCICAIVFLIIGIVDNVLLSFAVIQFVIYLFVGIVTILFSLLLSKYKNIKIDG